jgi:flagellar FliL protein
MKADPKAAAATDAAPKGKSKMMIIIIAVVLLAAIGGGAAFFMTRGGGEEHAEAGAKKGKKAAKAAPPEYVALESFTVNLQPENGDQYLQVQMTLQVNGAEQAEVIKTNMAKVRSRVLMLLSSKKASEINTVEGKKKLAEEVVTTVKEPFFDKGDEQEVSEVLFTSFIIQ